VVIDSRWEPVTWPDGTTDFVPRNNLPFDEVARRIDRLLDRLAEPARHVGFVHVDWSPQLPEQWTWMCMVCRRERPDRFIAVAHRPAPWFEDRFPACRVNVRYCNDRAMCAGIATAPGPWQPPPEFLADDPEPDPT
jgi:hypothetical protein